MPVSLTNEQKYSVRTTLLKQASRRLLCDEKLPNGQVDILLIDDEKIHALNYEYRGYDKPTDVLSFAQRDALPGVPPIPIVPGAPVPLGDVVISVDTAIRQAAEHHVSVEQELALLAVHGILHLLGYEDDTAEGARAMHQRERELLHFTFPAAGLPE